jgi:hypothetical protein
MIAQPAAEVGNEQVQILKQRLANPSAGHGEQRPLLGLELLKVAVEWGAVKLLHRPHVEMRFHDFAEFERLVDAARKLDSRALVVVLLGSDQPRAARICTA